MNLKLEFTTEQARRLLLAGQGLLPPQPAGAAAPLAVVRQVCGLQAQDIFAANLGVRVRSTAATIRDVDAARFAARSVVWTWAMRGTLHLLATEDLDWLLPLTGEFFVAAAARRRRELGLDEERYRRGLAAVSAHLAAHGPATREELVDAFAAAGIAGGYPIERHLLYRAALEGVICFGPDRGPRPTYVLLEDWLGRRLAPVARPAALAELAGRYLAAYGPATPADLAAWSGLPMSVVREAWAAVAGDLVEVTVVGRPAWLPAARVTECERPAPAIPAVRLLPAFDTYLLGHRSRDLILDPAFGARINAGGGMIRAVVLLDGAVAGTWQSNRKGHRVNITLDPFAPLPPTVSAAIAAQTADIERFLADPD